MGAVMLAVRGKPEDIPRLEKAGWLFDFKVDGCRTRVVVDDGGHVSLTSRTGADMTYRYPEITLALKEQYPDERRVFDAEIAVCDRATGLPSWPLSHKREMQQSRIGYWQQALPATLFVFDILTIGTTMGTTDLTRWEYRARRSTLDVEALDWVDPLRTTICSPLGGLMWQHTLTAKTEGLIVKNPASLWVPRRSPDWVKIKRTNTATCLVGGTDPGEGSRASTFGALHLYLLNGDQQLVPVGKVGSGFNGRELKEVMRALHHPPLIVEVEYLDVSPDGVLRQPVFQRIRTDVDLTACTLNQLEVA